MVLCGSRALNQSKCHEQLIVICCSHSFWDNGAFTCVGKALFLDITLELLPEGRPAPRLDSTPQDLASALTLHGLAGVDVLVLARVIAAVVAALK